MALKDELIEEKEVCEKAFFDFSQDHFLDWVIMFAENLIEKVDGVFYSLAGEFLLVFIENEKKNIAQIIIKD